MTDSEIQTKIDELEAEKLLTSSQIMSLMTINEQRAVIIHELKRQQEILESLKTIDA